GVDNEGNVVNAHGQRLQAYPSAGDGLFNTGAPADLRLATGANPPQATTSASLGINLPADAEVPAVAFDPTDPSSFNHTTAVSSYDGWGGPHTATIYFIQDAAVNPSSTEVQIDGTPVTGSTQVGFNDDGSLQSPAGGMMPLDAHT